MKSLLLYLLQVIAASAILYSYYHVFLRNKKFHQYNRFYLLAAVIISILVPFLHIPVYFPKQEAASSFVLQTLGTISSPAVDGPTTGIGVTGESGSSSFNFSVIFYFIYGLLVVLALTRLLASLQKIRKLRNTYPVEKLGPIWFVNTTEPGTPFSFFRWMFWNTNIELRSAKGEQVFRHELYHIQQKHSLDIIFMELLTVIFWINPFFHLVKKEIRAIHEFLADQFAITESSKWEYAELLLMRVLNTKHILVNPFFHNQIKRRIAMITNPKRTSHQYLRKLLVLPVAAVVVTLFAFKHKNKIADLSSSSPAPLTLVIDAGHGGLDPGAKSPDGKYSEAQLSLEMAMTIQSLAKEYNIHVVMTRDNDALPGGATNKNDGIKKRVEIANEVNADAFIALHFSMAAGKPQYQNKLSGIEAYVSARKNVEKDKKLASAVLQNISSFHKTDLVIRQRQAVGIYVLDKSSYPSIIVMCGYMNNQADMDFITDKGNMEKIARGILDAVVKYKKSEDNAATPGANAIPAGKRPEPADTTPVSKKGDIEVRGVEIEEEIREIPLSDSLLLFHLSGRPLIVVNGKEMPGLTMREVDVRLRAADIQSVTVLKDELAKKKYGDKGKNGVVEIITKKGGPETPKLREVIIQDYTVQDDKVQVANKIFARVEIEAAFPGGEGAWKKYVSENFDSSIPGTNGATAGTYNVWLQFVVDKEGNPSDVKALTNHGFGMEQEAIKLVRKGPKWLPAIQNGKTVSAYKKKAVTVIVPGKVSQKGVLPTSDEWQRAANTVTESKYTKKRNDVNR